MNWVHACGSAFALSVLSCTAFAEPMSQEKIDEYQEAFIVFDKNENGVIESTELAAVMKSLGQNPTPDEIRDMIAESDLSADGKVDFVEFLQMMQSQAAKTTPEQETRDAFAVFDQNQDLQIDTNELYEAMVGLHKHTTRDEVAQMIAAADQNGDKLISFDEYITMMTAE